MGLDLAQTAPQVESLALHLKEGAGERQERMERLLGVVRETSVQEVGGRIAKAGGRPFLVARPLEELGSCHSPCPVPADFCVAAVDGSHIDVDRHLPARCFLVNLGGCVLYYGSSPDAHLYSRPRVHSREEELYLAGGPTDGADEVPIEGSLLGLLRSVQEVWELAEVAEGLPPRLPALALIDGSLVLWGLSGRGYPEFVREELLGRRLLPSLGRLMALAQGRPLALAAYVSLPQSTEVIHTLRVLLCGHTAEHCRGKCSLYRSREEPCNVCNGFLDREFFARLLDEGERSCLFATEASISRDFYGPHGVHFYYLNAGYEIARVEVPQWVAADPDLLALSHSLVLDQCRRGGGYPTAIMEAHEQAVIGGPERETFRQMVEDALGRRDLPVYTSEKSRSKRVPGL